MTLHKDLLAGLEKLNLEISEAQQNKLIEYLYLLQKWNKHFNLTAIREIEQMLPLHLFDSLSIIPFIQGKNILDVGTGAGLPGIPLSICFPDKKFSLLDSNGKKTRFCRQVVNELSLANVSVHQMRVEKLDPEEGFDLITTRALADLPKMLDLLKPLMKPETILLAMKGVLPNKEIKAIETCGYEVVKKRLEVPEISAERHVLLIKQSL